MCTDTYTAGIVVKELGLLEKRLPKDGKYKGVKFQITWSDYASGGPITNQMLANRLSIGVMGDYPLIVNGAKFQETKSLRTLYVAGTGYNLKGSGNAIVVPVNSDIYSIDDLKGKSVSTPVGSAAWGMLLKAMQDANIPTNAYQLKNQAPAVGAANIADQPHRRPRRLLSVVGDHGIPRHRPENLRRLGDRHSLSARRRGPRGLRQGISARSSSPSSRRSTRPANGSRPIRCAPSS